MTKRAFVSFGYDHDKDLHGNLVRQSARTDSPFRICDQSLPSEVHDHNWKRKARKRIGEADVVIFICDLNTHSAEGVVPERSITQNEWRPKLAARGAARL